MREERWLAKTLVIVSAYFEEYVDSNELSELRYLEELSSTLEYLVVEFFGEEFEQCSDMRGLAKISL